MGYAEKAGMGMLKAIVLIFALTLLYYGSVYAYGDDDFVGAKMDPIGTISYDDATTLYSQGIDVNPNYVSYDQAAYLNTMYGVDVAPAIDIGTGLMDTKNNAIVDYEGTFIRGAEQDEVNDFVYNTGYAPAAGSAAAQAEIENARPVPTTGYIDMGTGVMDVAKGQMLDYSGAVSGKADKADLDFVLPNADMPWSAEMPKAEPVASGPEPVASDVERVRPVPTSGYVDMGTGFLDVANKKVVDNEGKLIRPADQDDLNFVLPNADMPVVAQLPKTVAQQPIALSYSQKADAIAAGLEITNPITASIVRGAGRVADYVQGDKGKGTAVVSALPASSALAVSSDVERVRPAPTSGYVDMGTGLLDVTNKRIVDYDGTVIRPADQDDLNFLLPNADMPLLSKTPKDAGVTNIRPAADSGYVDMGTGLLDVKNKKIMDYDGTLIRPADQDDLDFLLPNADMPLLSKTPKDAEVEHVRPAPASGYVDMGTGVLDVANKKIVDYDGKAIRVADQDELDFLLPNADMPVSEKMPKPDTSAVAKAQFDQDEVDFYKYEFGVDITAAKPAATAKTETLDQVRDRLMAKRIKEMGTEPVSLRPEGTKAADLPVAPKSEKNEIAGRYNLQLTPKYMQDHPEDARVFTDPSMSDDIKGNLAKSIIERNRVNPQEGVIVTPLSDAGTTEPKTEKSKFSSVSSAKGAERLQQMSRQSFEQGRAAAQTKAHVQDADSVDFVRPEHYPGTFRQIIAGSLGNIPLIGKLFELSRSEADAYVSAHSDRDGKLPYLLRPWGTNEYGGTLFGNKDVRGALATLTLGMVPVNERQAAEIKAERGSAGFPITNPVTGSILKPSEYATPNINPATGLRSTSFDPNNPAQVNALGNFYEAPAVKQADPVSNGIQAVDPKMKNYKGSF